VKEFAYKPLHRRSVDCPLKGLWRLRIGKYRIIYEIYEKEKAFLRSWGGLKNSLSIDPLRILSIISKGKLNIFNLVG
jgi:hypothetical protein